jgi:hypothetical protein
MSIVQQRKERNERVIQAWISGDTVRNIAKAENYSKEMIEHIIRSARKRGDPRVKYKADMVKEKLDQRNNRIMDAWAALESFESIAKQENTTISAVVMVACNARKKKDPRAIFRNGQISNCKIELSQPDIPKYKPEAKKLGIIAETKTMYYPIIGLGEMRKIPVSLPAIILSRSRWFDLDDEIME